MLWKHSRLSHIPRSSATKLTDVENVDLVFKPLNTPRTVSAAILEQIEGVTLAVPNPYGGLTLRYLINLLLKYDLPLAGNPTMATTIFASE